VRIYFPDLAQFKNLLLSMQLKPKKGIIAINTPLIKFLHVIIEVFECLHKYVYVFLHDCAQCHLKLQRVKNLVFFCFDYFFASKHLKYIAKDVSILHLKLGNSNRPSYFPTSTSSKHTPHRHNWPMRSNWLLRWRDFDI
jgi:hypothetical protein